MPSLKDLLQPSPPTLHPFAIIEANGQDVFVVTAEDLHLHADGHLAFTIGAQLVAVVRQGDWSRVLRDVSLSDFTGEL